MHIPDGLLPVQVCVGGYAITGLTTWYCLRQIDRRPNPTAAVPKAALLTAVFFVASSIHIPIPPAGINLVLSGLLGAVLGDYAFLAVLIGLFFQAVMFGHGGLTTLGINAVIMGIPALLAHHLFRLRLQFMRSTPNQPVILAIFAFLAGAVGLGLAALIFLALIITTIPSGFNAATERSAVYGLSIAYIPLMIIEGIFTALLVLFLQRVKPELLKG